MNKDEHKLDNPVWHSLEEAHQEFSVTYGSLKCYQADICPFGGYLGSNRIADQIDAYAALIDNFYIVGERPEFSSRLKLDKELVCLQMVIDHSVDLDILEDVVPLSNHRDALFELVNMVQPGYFKRRTSLLGNYYGIFKNNELVAVTGERMKMNGLTEVSAVVTHPRHVGNGYAKQLVGYTVEKILEQGDTPFLHVTETNTGAIGLYEGLGFKTRRKISFWNFVQSF
ncbi:MAG TPA: GNAT family N-acetyltransferase [Chitinophagaceae bacterium]